MLRMTRPRTVLAMDPELVDEVLTPSVRTRLEEIADMAPDARPLTDFSTERAKATLADAEILLTSWGCPRIDADVLALAPRLRAVVHAAGSVKPVIAPEVYACGVRVSSAASANAVPVAEFTYAAIVFGAKRVFPLADRYRRERASRSTFGLERLPWIGTAGLTIGVIGASRTGRRLMELLRTLDVRVLIHDPYLDAADAAGLDAEPVDLDSLVATSDVVTVHAPDNPSTYHLLDARRIGLMRPGVLLVNTARGRLVDTEALVPHLVSGRIDAVLDVSDPEPLPPDSPLWDLPNVLLTPHLAGALGNEVGRLGAAAVDEIARFIDGRGMQHEVRAAELERIA
jgi:phosphoglycerate dehydrogenase-like enzyme